MSEPHDGTAAISEPEVPSVPQVLWSVRTHDKLFGCCHTRWYDNEQDADDYIGTLDDSDCPVKRAFRITALGEDAEA